MRATVGLQPDEVETIEKIREGSSLESAALDSLTGITVGPKASAAQSVHALVVAGIQAVEEKALEIGYRREAEYEASHPDCVAWRRAMRNRRLRAFMDNQEHPA